MEAYALNRSVYLSFIENFFAPTHAGFSSSSIFKLRSAARPAGLEIDGTLNALERTVKHTTSSSAIILHILSSIIKVNDPSTVCRVTHTIRRLARLCHLRCAASYCCPRTCTTYLHCLLTMYYLPAYLRSSRATSSRLASTCKDQQRTRDTKQKNMR